MRLIAQETGGSSMGNVFTAPVAQHSEKQEQAMKQVREWVRDSVLEPQDVELAISQGYHMAEAISHQTALQREAAWERPYSY